MREALGVGAEKIRGKRKAKINKRDNEKKKKESVVKRKERERERADSGRFQFTHHIDFRRFIIERVAHRTDPK